MAKSLRKDREVPTPTPQQMNKLKEFATLFRRFMRAGGCNDPIDRNTTRKMAVRCKVKFSNVELAAMGWLVSTNSDPDPPPHPYYRPGWRMRYERPRRTS